MKNRFSYRFTAVLLVVELMVAGLVPLIHHVCAMDGGHGEGICCCDDGHEGMMREEHHAMPTEEGDMPCSSHEGMEPAKQVIETCCTSLSDSIDYRAIRKAISEVSQSFAVVPESTLHTNWSPGYVDLPAILAMGPPGHAPPLYLVHASFLI